MPSPNDRRYLDSHEWHRPTDDGHVEIGISQFAVDELTDITYLEVLIADGSVSKGDTFGEIESVKATSDLYCGIDGEVVAVNQPVIDEPSAINDDPYAAWLIRVRPSDPAQVEALAAASDYDAANG
ncbi:MAG: glycine cleavage system protein GcvH [Planctomycetota bacterium]